MSIKIKNLTAKNFMSVGNATQGVDFDRQDLTLVLGENLDTGNEGSRNGTGKTTIVNALSYALYGQAISNIKKDNLINRTNGKNMLVSVDFSVNDKNYRIERGRKPNLLKFYIGDEEHFADETQGENKETQAVIVQTLGMGHELFKHIVALNTYTDPFLSLKAGDQREIIEHLMGITLLSERAEKLKELIKQTKNNLTREEIELEATKAANQRIQIQIDSLKAKQASWLTSNEHELGLLISTLTECSKIDIEGELAKHKQLTEWQILNRRIVDFNTVTARSNAWLANKEQEIQVMTSQVDGLLTVNIESELTLHKQLAEWQILNRRIVDFNTVTARSNAWLANKEQELLLLTSKFTEYSKVNIEDELAKHKQLTEWRRLDAVRTAFENLTTRSNAWLSSQQQAIADLSGKYNQLLHIDIEGELKAHAALGEYHVKARNMADLSALIKQNTVDFERLNTDKDKLNSEIAELRNHKCYACGQQVADDIAHRALLEQKIVDVDSVKDRCDKIQAELDKNVAALGSLGELGSKPVTVYQLESQAVTHLAQVENLKKQIQDKQAESNPHAEQLAEYRDINLDIGPAPVTQFDTEAQVIQIQAALENLQKQIQDKQAEINPHAEQLAEYRDIDLDIGPAPVTQFDTEAQVIQIQAALENLQKQIETKQAESNPHAEQLAEYRDINLDIGPAPVTQFDTEAQVIQIQAEIENLKKQIQAKQVGINQDPYAAQIKEMEVSAIKEVSYKTHTELTRMFEHQDFLLKLLTGKDSFIRKKIIEQNLGYLNQRLTYYLHHIGLPHQVIFQQDLTVEITELGRDLDFDNLSRGERNRLILSLSWAFRDVWETLYSPINLLFIDELIDNGLDTSGVESALTILKQVVRTRNKSIWLVSHREELIGRVNNTMKVIKSNGFTEYTTETA